MIISFVDVQFIIYECKRVGEFALKVKKLHTSITYDIKRGQTSFRVPLLTDVAVQGDVKIEFFKCKLKRVRIIISRVKMPRVVCNEVSSRRRNCFIFGSILSSFAKFWRQIYRKTIQNKGNRLPLRIRAVIVTMIPPDVIPT